MGKTADLRFVLPTLLHMHYYLRLFMHNERTNKNLPESADEKSEQVSEAGGDVL